MSELLTPALFGLIVALTFFFALAAYSLRDFSRSRLEALCRQANQLDRFSEILKQHELETFGWAAAAPSIDGKHVLMGNFFDGDVAKFDLETGEIIIMPANIPHAIEAINAFKMLLTMIKSKS